MLTNSITFSLDDTKIAFVTSEINLFIYDSTSGELLYEKADIRCVTFFDEHTIIVGTIDSPFMLWDLVTNSEIARYDGHDNFTRSVVVTSDQSKIVSCGEDKIIRIWDVKTKCLLRKLRGHTNVIYSVALSKDERTIISASRDKSVKIWDFESGRLLDSIPTPDQVWTVDCSH